MRNSSTSVFRVHGFSPGDRIATFTISLCTSIPATRSYSTFICAATSSAAPPTDRDKARHRQGPGQYRRLTHAHAAATGVTRHGAPAPNLLTASNGPSQTGDDERHASTTMHFPPGPAIARPRQKTPAARDPHRPTAQGPSCRIPRQRHAVANEFLLGLPPT